jgi:hypothetical protein
MRERRSRITQELHPGYKINDNPNHLIRVSPRRAANHIFGHFASRIVSTSPANEERPP